MVVKLHIRLVLKNKNLLGWAENRKAYINLKKADTTNELIDTINHEVLHLILTRIARTTEKQDHYILKRLQIDWF